MYLTDPFTGIGIIFVFVFLILIVLTILTLATGTKSKRYRKMITDMYIAGKVRQFAETDKIDLEVEYNRFRNWLKKNRIEDEELDKTIEREVQERVAESEKEKLIKK